jgi:hypothetical protein
MTMKPTLELFLTVTIFAGLLMSASPVPTKPNHAEARMQAALQNQLANRHAAEFKARARIAAPGQLTGPGISSTMWFLEQLPAADPQSVSRPTELAGIPYDIWCMIHFCKRWG